MPQNPPARRQLYDDLKEWGSIRDLDFETFSQELDASERFREGVKREFTRQAGRHGIEIDDAFDFDTIFGIKKKEDSGSESPVSSGPPVVEVAAREEAPQEQTVTEGGLPTMSFDEFVAPEDARRQSVPVSTVPQSELETIPEDEFSIRELEQQTGEFAPITSGAVQPENTNRGRSTLEIMSDHTDPEGDLSYFAANENLTPMSFSREGYLAGLNDLLEQRVPGSPKFEEMYEEDEEGNPQFSQMQMELLSEVSQSLMSKEVADQIMLDLNLDPETTSMEHFLGRVGAGAGQVPVSIVGRLLNVANSFNTARNATAGDYEGVRRNMARQDINLSIVENLRERMDTVFQRNPELIGDFMLDKVPQGLGSTVGIMATGAGTPVGMAISGGAVNSQDMFEEAIRNGASQGDANTMAGLGFLIGLAEAIPISGAMNRAGSVGGVKKFLKDMLIEGSEEGVQETMNAGLNNFSAQQVYDASREIFNEETWDQAAVGFVSGALFAGGISGVTNTADAISSALERRAENADAEMKEKLLAEAQRVREIQQELTQNENQEEETQQEAEQPAVTSPESERLPQDDSVEIEEQTQEEIDGEQATQTQPETGDAEATTEAEEVVEPTPQPEAAEVVEDTTNATQEQLNTREETLPQSRAYRLVRTPEGALDIERLDGKEGRPEATRKARERLIKKYLDENDFSDGETSSTWMENNDPNEFLDPSMSDAEQISRTSSNVYELADAAVEEGARIDETLLDPRMMAIADAITEAGSVKRSTFVNDSDENNVGQSLARSYLSKDGVAVDLIALSANSNFYGDEAMSEMRADEAEITPDDVVDFMLQYPNGVDSFISQANPDYDTIIDKMEQVLGFRPTPGQVEQLAGNNGSSTGQISGAPQEAAGQSTPKIERPEVAISSGKPIVPKGTVTPAGTVTGQVNTLGAHEVETTNGKKVWLRPDQVADLVDERTDTDDESKPDAKDPEVITELLRDYNNLVESGLSPSEAAVKIAARTKQGVKKAHVVKQQLQMAGMNNRAQRAGVATTPMQIRNIKAMESVSKVLAKAFPGIKVIQPQTLAEFNDLFKELGGRQMVGPTGPYGFTHEGVIYLNPSVATAETRAHEYGHIWVTVAKMKFKSLYQRAEALVKGSPYYDIALQEYGEFDNRENLLNEELVMEEAIVQAMAEKAIQMEADKSKYRRFREWMNTTLKKILRKMGVKVRRRIETKLPDMTFDELIQEFSNDMLSGIPLGNITSEHIARAGDPEVFSSITVDHGLLATDLEWDPRLPKSESDSRYVKEYKKWVNKIPRSNKIASRISDLFSISGGLPKIVAENNRQRLRNIKSMSVKVEDIVADFKRQVKETTKTQGEAFTKEQMLHFSNVISDMDDHVRATSYQALDPEFKVLAADMREMVDNLTNAIRATGLVGEKLDATMSENLGIYLHRSYKVWDEKGYLGKVIDTPAWNKALAFVQKRGQSKDIRNVRGEAAGRGLYNVTFTNKYGVEAVITGVSLPMLKSYVGTKAYNKLKPKLKGYPDSFSKSFRPDPETGIETQADVTFTYDLPDAKNELLSFLNKGKEIRQGNEVSGGSKIGTKNLDIFKKRKDIAPQIREIMGEYDTSNAKELPVVIARTVMKQVAILENEKFLNDLLSYGQGTFLHQQPTGIYTEKIAGDQSTAYAPLNGYFTSPEILAAMEGMRKNQRHWMVGAIQTLNSMAKVGATVLSPSTHMRNIYGAAMVMLGQDVGTALRAKKRKAAREAMGFSTSARTTGRANLTRGRHKSAEAKAYYNKLRELGVVDDNAYVGIIDDSIRLSEESSFDKVAEVMDKVAGAPGKFYQAPDDISKIIAFENEMAWLIEANPDQLVDGKPTEQMMADAASIVRATIPTYSLTPQIIKMLGRNPLFGTFVSFSAEMVRTSYNTMRIGLKETRSDNPVVKQRGIRRIASQALMASAGMALSQIGAYAVELLYGVDAEEEDEYARRFKPAFAKYSTTIPLPFREENRSVYIDISYIDPWNMFWRPLMAFHNNDSYSDKIGKAAGEMAAPFFGTEMGLSAIVDVLANDRDIISKWFNDPARGQYKIYETNESFRARILGGMGYLWDEMKPGAMKSFDRIMIAAGAFEKQYEAQDLDLQNELMNTFLGVRLRSDNIEKGMKFRGRNMTQEVRLNRELAQAGNVDRANKLLTEAAQSLREDMKAAEYFGISPREVDRILNKESGLSQKLIRAIRTGKFKGIGEDGKLIYR